MDFGRLFEDKVHPDLVHLARYCQSLAGDREMPRRQDFRPSQAPSILEGLFLVDVLPGENDYYFSLFGAQISMMYGFDMTKRRLSTLEVADVREAVRKTYDEIVKIRRPVYLRGKYTWPGQELPVERLLIPLADDEGRLATILGAVHTDAPSDQMFLYTGLGPALLVAETTY